MQSIDGVDVFPAIGWPTYFVADGGRVWRHKDDTIRELKPFITKKSYVRIHLFNDDGKMKTVFVHHIVLNAIIGPCPDNMECRHLDGNPSNNYISNLVWGTHSENMQDRNDHGRMPNTLRTIAKKHNDTLIAKAIELRAADVRIGEIVQATGISRGHLYRLFKGQFHNITLPEGMPNKGRGGRGGERSSMAKLSDLQAEEIRSRRASGEMLKDIAPDYGVSLSCISHIATGRSRKSL